MKPRAFRHALSRRCVLVAALVLSTHRAAMAAFDEDTYPAGLVGLLAWSFLDTTDDNGCPPGTYPVCSGVCEVGPGPNSVSRDPVQLTTGAKIEYAEDLRVPLTGEDFVLRRWYTSHRPTHYTLGTNGNYYGMGWWIDTNPFLYTVDRSGTFLSGYEADIYIVSHPHLRTRFGPPGASDPPYWTTDGPGSSFVAKTWVPDIDNPGDWFPVFELRTPGRPTLAFNRVRKEIGWYNTHDPLPTGGALAEEQDYAEGFLREIRDPHGNLWNYTFSSSTGRLSSIRCFSTHELQNPSGVGGAYVPEATIEFVWNGAGALLGRLDYVRVLRPTSGGSLEVQRVDYRYFDEVVGTASLHVGYQGDLVEAVSYERVDDGPDANPGIVDYPARTRVTQYRYHRGFPEGAGPTEGDDLYETLETLDLEILNEGGGTSTPASGLGGRHQLKAVFEPRDLEAYAQEFITENPTATWVDAMDELLTRNDFVTAIDGVTGGYLTLFLASKWIAVYEHDGFTGDFGKRVRLQFLKTSCGCGGASAFGVMQHYDYYEFETGTPTSSTTITERLPDSSGMFSISSSAYRRRHFDFVETTASDIPYLVNEVVEVDGDFWVTHYEYDSVGRPVRKMTPSATASYTRPSNQASYTASASSGLVHAFAYSNEGYVTETRISDTGERTNFSDYTLLSRVTYGTGSGPTRTYLPVKIERFRTDDTSPGADDVEVIEFSYGFYVSNFSEAIAWIETEYEAEATTEGGPGGTYSRFQLFDESGRVVCERLEDGAINRMTYQSTTGLVAETVENTVRPSNDWPDYTNINQLDISVWAGRKTDGGARTTETVRDALGRRVEQISAGGVHTYWRREMQPFDFGRASGQETEERDGLEYYVEIELPHILDAEEGSYAGPAMVSWYDAADRLIGESDFALPAFTSSPPTDYDGFDVDYLDQELTRWTAQHTYAGATSSERRWRDIANDGYHQTDYGYDARGRLIRELDAEGTITKTTFDVFDRITEIETGTDDTSPGNMRTVVEYRYDGATTSALVVGNGNPTNVREHVNDSIVRSTTLVYDGRDRLVRVIRPLAPHGHRVYDNLNRVVESGLFSSLSTDIGVAPTLSNRGLHRIDRYSQRGLVWQQAIAIDPTLDPEDSGHEGFLVSDYFYDAAGREIAERSPNGPVEKVQYDGLGRAKAVFVTDRAGDGSVDGGADIVLEQIDYIFEIDTGSYTTTDRLLMEEHRRRAHDAPSDGGSPATGNLKSSGSVAADDVVTSYTVYRYDDADRPVKTIEYGTATTDDLFKANATAPDPAATPPGYALVSETVYGNRGLEESLIDPEGRITRLLYDDADRVIASIENFDAVANDVVLAWSGTNQRWSVTAGLDPDDPDLDRVTSTVYDGLDRPIKVIAHAPVPTGGSGSELVQVTQYVYGTPSPGTAYSELASKDLLYKIHYPNETTGEANTGAASTEEFAYNRQGELIRATDQNGTVHVYTRDSRGRATRDDATPGTGIDAYINRIEADFDSFGRLAAVRSQNNSTIRNEVEFTFTSLWQLEDLWQDPDSAVDQTGTDTTSKKIAYTYDVSDGDNDNHARIASCVLPTGASTIDKLYGPSGELNDRISRIVGYNYPELAVQAQLTVDYVGLDIPAQVSFAGVRLNRVANPVTSAKQPGVYYGYDRFGRVREQLWTHLGWDPDPNLFPLAAKRVAIVDLEYGYDKNSNVTHRWDRRGRKPQDGTLDTVKRAQRDEKYEHDGLDRLTLADRGKQDHGTSTFTRGGVRGQQWTLDALGNWLSLVTNDATPSTYDSSDTATRGEFNSVNEILEYGVEVSSATPAFTYDDAGNLKTRQVLNPSTGAVASTWSYKMDAWDRLVEVSITQTGSVPRARFSYNGLHQRVTRIADTDFNGSYDEYRFYYYDIDWRLREEHIDDDWDGFAFAYDRAIQRFWGLTYIDEQVYYQIDTDGDGAFNDELEFDPDGAEGYYTLYDMKYDGVAVLDRDGGLVERVRYTAYGVARHEPFGDVSGDGVRDTGSLSADSTQLVAALGGELGKTNHASYDPDADLNFDGKVNSTDSAIFAGLAYDAGLPEGFISQADNAIGYAGYVHDHTVGLHLSRYRWYDPERGRWVNRDPIGYADGMSLYEYALCRPLSNRDPSGLACICEAPLQKAPFLASPQLGPYPNPAVLPLPSVPFGPGSQFPPYPAMIPDYLDHENTRPLHEHIFYDDGKRPRHEGFFPNGVRPDSRPNPRQYYFNCDCGYDDQLMRAAAAICKTSTCFGNSDYRLLTNNCQDFTECVRQQYRNLERLFDTGPVKGPWMESPLPNCPPKPTPTYPDPDEYEDVHDPTRRRTVPPMLPGHH